MAWTLSRATPRSANLAVRVQKEDANAALSRILAAGQLDKRRKILVRGELVEIPLKGPVSDCQTFCQDEPEFYRRMPELKELLEGELSSEEMRLLPKGWYILGKIVIVKIPPQLEHLKHRIGEALLSMYPRCKTVLRDTRIEGQLRQPVREILAGSDTKTVHRENGVLFRLDAMRIMFSQGNLRERMRMALLGRDEQVVDMFAGIGYFTLPMAVHSKPRHIMAIELNPESFSYLKENIRLNHVENIVQPILGDCSEMTPEGEADRVVMGYVGTTDRYLKTGIEALRPGGVLHYHQTVPSWLYPSAAVKDVVEAAKALDRRADVLGCTKVKKYSPGVVHAVVDARIDGNF